MYIKYIYNQFKDINEGRTLIGVEIVFEEVAGVHTQEIYIGKSYSIAEFIQIAPSLNVKAATDFIASESIKRNSERIVYFPSIHKFGFLGPMDIVVNNSSELNNLIPTFQEKENLKLIREKE